MSERRSENCYVLVGGGSGGHLTPLIPISEAIKDKDDQAFIVHIGQKGDKLNSILDSVTTIDAQYYVRAGKYRRYNGENIIRKILDFKTIFLNIRDMFYFVAGTFQSYKLLKSLKPKVVFTKGGFVCAPVGLAAGFLGIPYITHDSDAMVSLAHRIISKKAKLHLTAMPAKYYAKYQIDKVIQVGVPVRREFSLVTLESKKALRQSLGFRENDKIVLALGGGLGAKNINDTILAGSKLLLSDENVRIVLIAGHKLYPDLVKSYDQLLDGQTRKRVLCLEFANDLYKYSGSADVIVTRAGATNMAEFAAQGRACIIVPNPLLTGGHQLKNAQAYVDMGSAITVSDQDAKTKLTEAIINLLNDVVTQQKLSDSLHAHAMPNASSLISENLISISNKTADR